MEACLSWYITINTNIQVIVKASTLSPKGHSHKQVGQYKRSKTGAGTNKLHLHK